MIDKNALRRNAEEAIRATKIGTTFIRGGTLIALLDELEAARGHLERTIDDALRLRQELADARAMNRKLVLELEAYER